MIVQECSYNPEKDLKPVEEFGFINLKEAFVNRTVPSNLPDSETDYNGISDPASIVGKPTDVFDALRMQSELMSRDKAVSGSGEKNSE